MWFKNIFNRRAAAATQPLFDEAFLRRLERLSLQAQRTLRGRPSGGEHLSRNQLPATIFSDHRPYSAGDDYRRFLLSILRQYNEEHPSRRLVAIDVVAYTAPDVPEIADDRTDITSRLLFTVRADGTSVLAPETPGAGGVNVESGATGG